MTIPVFFKYGSLVSIPLFSIIALLLSRQAPGFSLRKHTVSELINFIGLPSHRMAFRLNFVLKAFLDLGFSLYILRHYDIPHLSPSTILLVLSALLFASLTYYVEGAHTRAHVTIVTLSGIFWVLGQLLAVLFTGDEGLLILTSILITVPLLISTSAMLIRKSNGIVQALCMIMWYLWISIIVFIYL